MAPEAITTTCPRPVRHPVMLQEWRDLGSVHWPYDPDEVQRLLPAGLRVDTCGGVAWVGLIPFHMQRIRLPIGPAPGRWSTFPETNVRTYVVGPDGRRAVWFFSLDISRLVPAVVARLTYGLPYCWGPMSIEHRLPDVVEYTSSRRWPRGGSASKVAIRIGERVADSDLTDVERFVTARWALASTFARRTVRANVDHEPWPLHRSTLIRCDDSFVTGAGLTAPQGAPVVLWSPGVSVRVQRPVVVAPAGR